MQIFDYAMGMAVSVLMILGLIMFAENLWFVMLPCLLIVAAGVVVMGMFEFMSKI
jgi:hypothetical protein